MALEHQQNAIQCLNRIQDKKLDITDLDESINKLYEPLIFTGH